MTLTFSYDAAISAVGYDSATAQRLAARLRPRLMLPVFNSWEHYGTVGADGSVGIAARVLRRDARVVIVLHQRLWGATASTRLDAEVLERRVENEGTGFLRVIALETAELASWMPAVALRGTDSDPTLDATVDAVVAAVIELGGTARTETAAEAAARTTTETELQREHDFYLRSAGATAAAAREFVALGDEIVRELGERRPARAEPAPQIYRAPDRLIVQLGRAGLSLSRMRSSTGVAAEASLLVIEWHGTVTQPGSSRPRAARATPLREQVLHGDADKGGPWSWRTANGGQRVYSSRDLAAQCVHLLLRQLEEEEAASIAAEPISA